MTSTTTTQWMDAGNEQERKVVVNDIAGRLYTCLGLLADLKPWLEPNVDYIQAARGLKFMYSILDRLQIPPGKHELHLIAIYLTARLLNRDGVPSYGAGIEETALCLKLLAKHNDRFAARDVTEIAQAIFSLAFKDRLKALIPSTRLSLLELLGLLVANYGHVLRRDMGAEFIEGLVAMCEFEKDPSCLAEIFHLYAKLSRSWTILTLGMAKNMFGSFIRYFPIKVGGKKRDPSKPSTDELAHLLLECLVSNNLYAESAFEELCSRLDTTSDLTADTKKTIFATITSCVSHYSPSTVSKSALKLWETLQFEVWNGENDEFIVGALDVLREISRSLSTISSEFAYDEGPLVTYAHSIAKEVNSRVYDSRKRYLRPAGRILNAVACTSPQAFQAIIKPVLPVMLVIWQDLNILSEKNHLLEVLNQLLCARISISDGLKAISKIPGNSESDSFKYLLKRDETMSQDFAEFRQRLVDTYFGVTTENKHSSGSEKDAAYDITYLQGLVYLVHAPNLLSNYEIGTVIEELNKTALNKEESKEIKKQAVLSLQQISAEDPLSFRNITLTNFMSRLPDTVSRDPNVQKVEIDDAFTNLEALMKISCSSTCKVEYSDGAPPSSSANYLHRNFDNFQCHLLSKLFDGVLKHEGQMKYASAIVAAMYSGLDTFDNVLDEEAKRTVRDVVPYPDAKTGPYTWLVLGLYKRLVEIKAHEKTGMPYVALNGLLREGGNATDGFVNLVGKVATRVLQSKLTTLENNFVLAADRLEGASLSSIWSLFSEGDLKQPDDVSQGNLQNGPAERCSTNILSVALLAGLRPQDYTELKIRAADAAVAMIHNSISIESNCTPQARMSMLYFLQLMVNKFRATSETELTNEHNPVHIMKDYVASCPERSESQQLWIYQTLSYFTTASLACFDKSFETLISLMLNGITDPRVGRKAAESFRILVASSDILTTENFCIIRPLATQKLFHRTVEEIIKNCKSSGLKYEGIKANYLISLIGVLSNMPATLLTSSAPQILPFILEGTNVKDDVITKRTCIDLLHRLSPHIPSLLEEHLDSVIIRMTDRTYNTLTSPSDSPLDCRAKALDVLGLLPTFISKKALEKRKLKVKMELDAALDDCEPLVRHHAEQCKMSWFLMLYGEP
ncbi:hypothetical protein B7494_g8085 [Chlorociboria aeruginascens]|nr:hypothetical protein B7494_g8085 [Chlorociboria aeruginascens]